MGSVRDPGSENQVESAVTGLVGYKKTKPQKDMKLGGRQWVYWGRDIKGCQKEGMQGGYDQNVLYTCMDYLKRK